MKNYAIINKKDVLSYSYGAAAEFDVVEYNDWKLKGKLVGAGGLYNYSIEGYSLTEKTNGKFTVTPFKVNEEKFVEAKLFKASNEKLALQEFFSQLEILEKYNKKRLLR